jgi:glycosyltransferase involved in cell wall biosynthesis
MDQHPLVTVGMPIYNRPETLQRSLDSIRAQTYRHLEIIVSDNASPDPKVGRLISSAVSDDQRIRHFCQQTNIGPASNFAFVLSKARGTYFMWAADDDEWDSSFIEKLLRPLQENPDIGVSFCNFDVRYPDGELCLIYGPHYQSYRCFENPVAVRRVSLYAKQPPLLGKANIIYGLYRRSALEDSSVCKYLKSRAWGADMLLVCSVLSAWSFQLVPEKLYYVGVPFPGSGSVVQRGIETAREIRLRKWKLALSHALYFLLYLRIMAGSRGSTPLDTISLSLHLFPMAFRWIRDDLA